MNLWPGDLASMRQAKVTALNEYEKDGSAEGGDGEDEADGERPEDLASMRQPEVTALEYVKDGGSAEEGDGEVEADSEVGEPPEKKRCLEIKGEYHDQQHCEEEEEAKEASERSIAGKIIEMMWLAHV